MMTPWLEEALGHLLCRAKAELWAQYYREPWGSKAQRAILQRISAVHSHMCKVAVRSKSPAELRTRLIRDGTIRDEPVIEWYDRDSHYRDVSYAVMHGETVHFTR